jgi:RecA-family ATPase
MEKEKVKRYVDLIWRADKFVARPIPERTWLLEGAIPHPSLGLLYAFRGKGKTYTALDLSIALANGKRWMHWDNKKPREVLYIDGEMPLGDLRSRVEKLTQGKPPKTLWFLASEDMALASRGLDLTREADRKEITNLILTLERERGITLDLIVLDNWTSLTNDTDENDNAKLAPIKKWLVFLRHGERSVILVHHAGNSGTQRGATAREDVLDYSIRLEGYKRTPTQSFFRVTWDKTRSSNPDPESFIEVLRPVGKYMELVPSSETEAGLRKGSVAALARQKSDDNA